MLRKPFKVAGILLANHVTVCIDCHSHRDWSRYGGPIVPGTEGEGGERFDRSAGFPGTIYSRNITPAGLRSVPPERNMVVHFTPPSPQGE